MSALGLAFGDLELVDNDAAAYKIETLAEGTSWGNPQPIEVAIRSLLQDGSIVFTQGYDNREVGIRVIITASDSAALAEGESALFAEVGKRNSLTYTAPDGWGFPTVFDVVTSSLGHVPDDLAEVRGERTYVVRLLCAPFGRSVEEVVTEALPASGSTTTLVNAGSATTDWTGAINGVSATPTISSGALRVSTPSASTGLLQIDATLTTSIATSATPYLVVDWKPQSPAGSPFLEARGDGVPIPKMAETASPTAGYTRTWFGPVPAASIAVLKLSSFTTIGEGIAEVASTRSLNVANINRTDVAPSLGSGRQLLRSVPVIGSARTPGSIEITHASSALGDVMAYIYPDTTALGYSPPLRQYLVAGSGTVTPDSTMVSGARQDIKADPVDFSIPHSRLMPGRHLLMVRVSTTGAGNGLIVGSSATSVNGTQVGATETKSFSVGSPSSQTIFAGFVLNLPSHAVSDAATTALQVIQLTAAASTVSTVVLDEAWLFNLDKGRLVGPVACGTGTAASGGPARCMFIRSATLQTSRPTILIGHEPDGSDAFYPATIGGWQTPEFIPERVSSFTVTTNAVDASVTLRHFPRWFTHAAS